MGERNLEITQLLFVDAHGCVKEDLKCMEITLVSSQLDRSYICSVFFVGLIPSTLNLRCEMQFCFLR